MTEDFNLGEIRFSRIYDAPIELVFDCMITPEHLTNFFGPYGISAPLETIVIDPRVGGVYDIVMVNDANGDLYPNHGIIEEIERPTRLATLEPDVPGGAMRAVQTFTDLGDGRTRVDIVQTGVPEMYRSPEAQAGMQLSFDRFAEYLTTIK